MSRLEAVRRRPWPILSEDIVGFEVLTEYDHEVVDYTAATF
jgi:hypothetical protein